MLARAKKSKKKRPSKPDLTCMCLDHSVLASGYHDAILGSLAFLPAMFKEECGRDPELCEVHMLLIGLGGGALPAFISKYLHNVRILERARTDCIVKK